MLKKVVKYIDFDDKERSDTLYFNLTKAEMLELALDYKQDVEAIMHRMVEDGDQKGIFDFVKDFIMRSYGERTVDGKFIKTKEISEVFSHSEAYSQLIDDVTTNSDEAIAFFKGILPEKLRPTA